ncbi:MarR family winged helix-turn-helix transcriptional regulator [Shewanella sp. A32]|uniref:MarR family winged helix-turn-helix transcriptional regulator n=1 Tax=Shewanella sp. A32 TaxID=3031327 RepID=UPI0023B997E0|nr:MarR family winged helix-turn-helix transcriptional regulator [Shewanella sp. A32]MDF0533382.1 MarR family winged helix-turn-helix transcriptional regulator [Shewanella sp. A32]
MTDILSMLSIAFQVHDNIAGLSLTQADVLKHTELLPGIRQVELADRMMMQPAKLGRIVDQLEEMGLLERRKPENDHRVNGLFVTPAATEKLKIIGAVVNEIWEPAWIDIDDAEIQLFRKVLLKIQQNLIDSIRHPGVQASQHIKTGSTNKA